MTIADSPSPFPKPAYQLLRWAGALIFVHILLTAPADPAHAGPLFFLRIPLDLLVLLVVVLVPWPRRIDKVLRWTIGVLLLLLVLLKLASFATWSVFARPFDLFLDLPWISAAWDWLVQSYGYPVTVGATATLICTAAILLATTLWSLKALGSGPARTRVRLATACVLVCAAVIAMNPPVATAASATFAYEQIRSVIDGRRADAEFAADLTADPLRDGGEDRLSLLKNTDVLLIFVESYGRDAIENADFSAVVVPALEELSAAVGKKRLDARSAWLVSPTFGGGSWLAHSTFVSGLWINDQRRYGHLIGSGRPTLLSDFRDAGWRTVAVMPQITDTWPEASFFGYDRVMDRNALGYRGVPFHYVTMPDQFTLSAFATRELTPDLGRAPVMAEIALASSHAPFTPVPDILRWSSIGDGAIFDETARTGDAPEDVWRRREDVLAYYGRSVAYVLKTLASFVATYGRDDLLLIIVGDHQPMRYVAGEQASHEVPVHLIARPELLRAIEGWNWTEGMNPGASGPVWRMDTMRGYLVRAFTPADEIPLARTP